MERKRMTRDGEGVAKAVQEVAELRTRVAGLVEDLKALRHKEAQYRSLVELAPDIIYCLAEDGAILFISRSVEALGYRPEELIGRRFEEIVHPDDVAKARNRFVERRIGQRATRELEVRLLTKAGGVREHDCKSVAVWARGLWDVPDEDIRNPEKNFLGTQGIARDITERKRAEAALAEKARELARSNEELERFAYEVSHDLQGPLATVVSLLDLLQSNYAGKLDAAAEEIIRQVVAASTRMSKLVRDLLEYSRVGRQGQEKTMVSAEAALQQVLANLAWEVERRAAVVSHGPLPAVFVHESQFLMLLQNLVHNGIKFNQSKPPRVHVAAEDRGGAWAFAVTDNGIGIAAEHAEAVFAMFRRLHDASVYEGSGIGLATCKKIVEHHGGVISVESQPGRGATFCFTLPKPPAEAAAPEA